MADDKGRSGGRAATRIDAESHLESKLRQWAALHQQGPAMATRSITSLSLTFGLVSIPSRVPRHRKFRGDQVQADGSQRGACDNSTLPTHLQCRSGAGFATWRVLPVPPGGAGLSPVHSANTKEKRAFAARFFFPISRCTPSRKRRVRLLDIKGCQGRLGRAECASSCTWPKRVARSCPSDYRSRRW